MAKPIKLLVGAMILGSMPFSTPLMGKPDVQASWEGNPIAPKQKAPNHRRPVKPLRKSKGNRHG